MSKIVIPFSAHAGPIGFADLRLEPLGQTTRAYEDMPLLHLSFHTDDGKTIGVVVFDASGAPPS